MGRLAGRVLVVAVLALVSGAVGADAAGACSTSPPVALIDFVGTVTAVDPTSSTATFSVDEVLPLATGGPVTIAPAEPIRLPVAGDTIEVLYGSPGDLEVLEVGQTYRVGSRTTEPVRWVSSSRDFFLFDNSGCGQQVTPAWTTRADGSSIEGALPNFVRRAQRGGYRWPATLAFVALTTTAAIVIVVTVRRRPANAP